MKTLKHALSMVLLAIASMLGFSGREGVCNNIATSVGTHANGIMPNLAAEVTMTTRFLLVQKGTAANGIIVNVAATRPWGVCLDEPTSGNKCAVALLGCCPGTLRVVANAAITVGQLCYTAAAGKVSPTYGATLFLVGRALTAADADGDVIEIAHMFPLVNAVNTL